MLFNVSTMHNIALVACWQEQLRWRTRPGTSPGQPSSCRVGAGQTLPGCLRMRRCCCFPGLHPCRALDLSGRKCTGAKHCLTLLPPLPPVLISRKGNPGDWAGQEPQPDSHLCQQRTRPAKRYHGAHPPSPPKQKHCLKPTGSTVQWCAWPYFCWECSSLPHQFHHACLMFPLLLCQIQITSYSRQGSVQSSIAHQRRPWQAVQKMEQSKWPAFKTNTISFTQSITTY